MFRDERRLMEDAGRGGGPFRRLATVWGVGATHLLRKLDARDRTHLVIAAYDAGLVSPRHRPSA